MRSGTLIREARERAGISQQELGNRSGLPQSTISQYETGVRQPGAETFLRLLAAAGGSISVLDEMTGIDCHRNAQVFLDLVSILDSVPIRDPGPLLFPAHYWKH